MKLNRKGVFYISCALFFILILTFFLFRGTKIKEANVSASNKTEIKAVNNEKRVEFLAGYGWAVDNEPMEISEVTIPVNFNDTYTKYNNIQKDQGFDLIKYKGRVCKKFTYNIKNYPNKSNKVRANILVTDGKIIGGDISSVEINGFMHGFENPKA